MKQFPELMPKGPAKFVPKIYGFKIFLLRGSKYEVKYDYQGKAINEDEIRQVLKKGNGDNALPPGIPKNASTDANKLADADMQN